MKTKLKAIPKFNSELAEQAFWETQDSTEYMDWAQAKSVRFPNLKPSTQAISLRLPVALLEKIKVEANRQDVPYQSLIKVWLGEKADRMSPTKIPHPKSSKKARTRSTVS